MSSKREPAPKEDAMAETGLEGERELARRVAVGPGGIGEPGVATSGGEDTPAADVAPEPDDGAADAPVPAVSLTRADASLLALVDRLTSVLERSDLGELEVAAGGTTIVLRAPAAIGQVTASAGAGAEPAMPDVAPGPTAAAPPAGAGAAAQEARPAVRAPLTGIYYGAPSPGATPYVAVGDHVAVGQIIGLIEAMKLFNEIKSDLAGRVVRVCVENGALVKTKQALIEVEPA